MRKFITLFLIILLLSSTVVFAHPGGTDGAGGHTNHSTGEYHYHHGYPAHQHTDGVCPYDFDDQTNRSSNDVPKIEKDEYKEPSYRVDENGKIKKLRPTERIERKIDKVSNNSNTSVKAIEEEKYTNHPVLNVLCDIFIVWCALALLLKIGEFLVAIWKKTRDYVKKNRVAIIQNSKDTLILILYIAIFFGFIGFLMAYSDGLLDDTIIAKIIPIVFPALIGSYLIVLNISNWQAWIVGTAHSLGFIFLISFIALVLCIIFLDTNILNIIATVIIVLTLLTLIVFWIQDLFNK